MNARLKKALIHSGSVGTCVLLTVFAIKLNPSLIISNQIIEPNHSRDIAYGNIFENQKNIRNHFNYSLNEDFFNESDPFQSMKLIRKRMEDHMRIRGVENVNDFNKREDDNFVYYDLKVNDLDSTPITTNTENGR